MKVRIIGLVLVGFGLMWASYGWRVRFPLGVFGSILTVMLGLSLIGLAFVMSKQK